MSNVIYEQSKFINTVLYFGEIAFKSCKVVDIDLRRITLLLDNRKPYYTIRMWNISENTIIDFTLFRDGEEIYSGLYVPLQ